MVGEFSVITGKGFTVNVAVAVDEHPFVVPVTMYEVVIAGETVMAFVFPPEFQLYVVPPLAVSVALCPAQIVGEFTVTTGFGLTVIVPAEEATHPVRVYVAE
jgi:hypothetical protein